MCGIYGKIRFDGRPPEVEGARRLCDLMRHRGPDDQGVHAAGPAVLAHRRLSVIDLSPRGHQPMANEDGSVWIVLNGEIYNFTDLRPGLEAKGHVFRSRTDTEVLLHLYEEEGPDCVERLRGMFAFAIWDERRRTLFLARDRVGKKPLFYHHGVDCFAFASEVASLASDPEIPREVDREGIHHYLTFQSVPAPWSAFRAIRKLPPAHWLRLRDGNVEIRRYWRLAFGPKFPAKTWRQRVSLQERVLDQMREAVRLRLVADVPVGALLSGGIDSSGVVGLMAQASPADPIRTYSVGFDETEYDELAYARQVARRFGTTHHEFCLHPKMADALPLLVEHFGEPFADPAALPLYHVTRTARQHVTVALCGDGGDECFAGYHRHKLAELFRRLPRPPMWAARWLAAALPRRGLGSSRSPWWVAHRALETLSLSPPRRNLRFFGHFSSEAKAALYTPEFATEMSGRDTDDLVLALYDACDTDHPLDRILYTDFHTYLPDTLLPKVDVTSMANSLEMRSPLLDHKLVEVAARLPASLKVRGLRTKHILKASLTGLLPREILHRPKMGFVLPLDRWFRGELRGMVHDTLLSSRATARGYFRPEGVRRLLDEHAARRWQWQYHIYNLLMLELWHQRFVDSGR